MAGFPFVVRSSFQALPHPPSVRAGVVGFNLSPVLTLCLFDGLLEGIAGFLRLVSCSLKAAALVFSSVRILPVIHGFWLGNVRMVTVGTTSSIHLLMKPVTEVVYSSTPLDESWKLFQSVLAKQSCSVASASSDHFNITCKQESGQNYDNIFQMEGEGEL